MASHDLQEPLRKIQQFGDILNQRYAPLPGQEGADLLHWMQGAAERMSVLIRDLLALSRLTIQHEPFADVDLDQLLNEVLADLDLLVRERMAIISKDKLGTLRGDASQLRQLLQNLLTNALKFTQPNEPPRIQVRCRIITRSDQPPFLAPWPRYICLSVTDNGIGLDAGLHGDRIFGTLRRLHSREQFAGTGIGLAVVRKVAERHGGSATVSSLPGEGSTFTIFLPN